MKTYEVQVTETINHLYIFEAGSSEEALLAYERLDSDQLETLDHDGMSCWDSKPWDIAICPTGANYHAGRWFIKQTTTKGETK